MNKKFVFFIFFRSVVSNSSEVENENESEQTILELQEILVVFVPDWALRSGDNA